LLSNSGVGSRYGKTWEQPEDRSKSGSCRELGGRVLQDGPENYSLIVLFVLRTKKKRDRTALRFPLQNQNGTSVLFNSSRYRF
jgi:hypothetical protein